MRRVLTPLAALLLSCARHALPGEATSPRPLGLGSPRDERELVRVVPLDFLYLRGDCECAEGTSPCGSADACAAVVSCPPLSTFLPHHHLALRVDYANRMFRGAGVQFYVRSIAQVAAPTLARPRSRPATWGRVRDDLRRMFPAARCESPTPHTAPLGEAQWSRLAATFFSPHDSITLIIHERSAGGDGGYPWKDRAVHTDIFNLSYNAHLAHELGHFLGLSHNFDNGVVQHGGNDLNSGTLRDPGTNALASMADFWDLVYREAPDPACGARGPSPCFFSSKRDALRWEAQLVPISRLNHEGKERTCVRGDPGEATGVCLVNGVERRNGDPLIAGVAFTFLDDVPLARPVRGWNGMDYLGPLIPPWGSEDDDWINALSPSQLLQVKKVFRHDVPMDQSPLYPGLRGGRPRLGQIVSSNLAARVDFNGDGQRDLAVWEPPARRGERGTLRALLSPRYDAPVVRRFGAAGDAPFAADLDGDGRSEFGVFHPGDDDPAETGAHFSWCPSLDRCDAPSQRGLGRRGDIPLFGLELSPSPGAELAALRPAEGLLLWDTALGLSPAPRPVALGPLAPGQPVLFERLDGDGLDDIVLRDPASAGLLALGSSSGWRSASALGSLPRAPSPLREALDALRARGQASPVQDSDGDGAPEILLFEAPSMRWTLLYSASGYDRGSALVRSLGSYNGVPL